MIRASTHYMRIDQRLVRHAPGIQLTQTTHPAVACRVSRTATTCASSSPVSISSSSAPQASPTPMRRIMKLISAAAQQPGFAEDAAADQDQGGAEYQRRCRVNARMTAGVRRIGRVGALAGGMDDEKIREQIGEGLQAVGNQRLRIGQPADNDLSDRQQDERCDDTERDSPCGTGEHTGE